MKRVKKKERTVEAKLAFGINEKIHVKCPKSKQWNLRGIIKEVRINEQGTICSYLVQLENGLITSRHRRCLKRDLPINDEMVVENEEPQVGNIPAAADIDDRAPLHLPIDLQDGLMWGGSILWGIFTGEYLVD